VCVWTKNLGALALPIRHGEGRVTLQAGEEEAIHRKLVTNGQIPLRYTNEVNGSYARIAGVCDPLGLVFGLMPHPEAAISFLQYPQSASL
ncbi:phosphoribosylformylglycinamidine synthase, partial [Pseudomonas sp. FW305-17]